MAAEPVSPEVAPTMVIRSPRRAQDLVEQPAEQLQRIVLEGERRAVEQLQEVDAVGEQGGSGAIRVSSKPR